MPRISVVIPIYEVERYLAACLHSVARQTVGDLEVIMVDDGSTDDGPRIAEEFARRDPRFRLLRQPNGGLGRARNTGTDAATGEFLVFLDSDDVLPSNAYELLLTALDETGSDFATGNVHRLTDAGTSQAAFVSKAFTRTRLRTHVARFPALMTDRTAWNKLWRRSFWDAHGLRFPEGVVHEDIPVVIPAHFMARSVDVIHAPVYRYRIRDDSERSITQRRAELRVLLDRLAAVEHVRTYLASAGAVRARRWYDRRIVADDLRLHLNVLRAADDEYRRVFLDRVNAMLDTAAPGVFRDLAAIDRLKWHLVRRRLLPELLEVLRFQEEDLARSSPVRERGRWYGDYPFRHDAWLAIPRSTYRLGRSDPELALTPHLDGLSRDDGLLQLRGRACITALGAPSPSFQRVKLRALRPGRLQRVRLRLTAVRLATIGTVRPDIVPTSDGSRDLSWSGFRATLDPRALRRGGRWVEGTWELSASVRTGLLRRRRSRFAIEDPRAARTVDLPVDPDVSIRAVATPEGSLTVQVRKQWAAVRDHRLEGSRLLLGGVLATRSPSACRLELRRVSDGVTFTYPLAVVPGRAPASFTAAVELADLQAAAPPPHDEDHDYRVWELRVTGGDRRLMVDLPDDVRAATWPVGAGGTSLLRTAHATAAIVEHRTRELQPDGSQPHGELTLP